MNNIFPDETKQMYQDASKHDVQMAFGPFGIGSNCWSSGRLCSALNKLLWAYSMVEKAATTLEMSWAFLAVDICRHRAWRSSHGVSGRLTVLQTLFPAWLSLKKWQKVYRTARGQVILKSCYHALSGAYPVLAQTRIINDLRQEVLPGIQMYITLLMPFSTIVSE